MFGLNVTTATFYHLARILFWSVYGILASLVPYKLRFHKSIKNDIVLLTGAGSGLGRQLALRLSALGANLVIWDINKRSNEETERLVRQKGGRVKSYVCDITDRQAVYDTAAKVAAEVGPVSILINNAGIYQVKYLTDLSDSGIIKTMETNALSNIWTIKAFLPDMIARNKGHIVGIVSISGHIGVPTQTDYCASKFAAIGFMEALSAELNYRGHGAIRTTRVCPYFFGSGLYKNLGSGLFPELTTERVADEAVGAILREDYQIIIPASFKIIVTLLKILPIQAVTVFADFLGLKKMLRNIQSNRHNPFEKNGSL